MRARLLRRPAGRDRAGQRPRRRARLTGCLLWALVLVVALVIVALAFGGFRKGTKAGGPAPHPRTAAAGPGAPAVAAGK